MGTEPTTEVNPADVAKYLERNGWFRFPETWRGAEVWGTGQTSRQIMLPPEIVYRDDHVLVWRAVQDLAEVEQRDPQSLLRVFLRRMVDRQVFRTHPDTPSGTVPLDSGFKAVEGIRLLFTAAAGNVHGRNKPINSGGRRPAAVDAFLKRVRLGPSEAGSYLFTTEVPVDPPEGQTSLDEGDPSTERAVIDVLRNGIGATARAVDDTLASTRTDTSPFDTAFEQGVSSQLCHGLYQLTGHSHNRPFEVEFHWASEQTSGDRDSAGDHLTFPDASGEVLKDAVKRLRTLEYRGTVTLTGKIVGLDREKSGTPGSARVRGQLVTGEGKAKGSPVLRIQLHRDQYDHAVRAHTADRTVTVKGRIEMVGARRELVPDRIDFGEKDGS